MCHEELGAAAKFRTLRLWRLNIKNKQMNEKQRGNTVSPQANIWRWKQRKRRNYANYMWISSVVQVTRQNNTTRLLAHVAITYIASTVSTISSLNVQPSHAAVFCRGQRTFPPQPMQDSAMFSRVTDHKTGYSIRLYLLYSRCVRLSQLQYISNWKQR
jgi:hypothetical protein